MATDDHTLTAPMEDPEGSGIPDAVKSFVAPPHEPQDGPPRSVPHWTGWLLVGLGLLTLPWIAGLAEVLPAKSVAAHYDVSWVGFDILLCALLLRTGWALLNDRRYVEVTAAMTAVLLVVDSWFDVMTSPTAREFEVALALAVGVQLPLACFCLWVAGRVEFERRERSRVMAAALRLLLRRRGPSGGPGGGSAGKRRGWRQSAVEPALRSVGIEDLNDVGQTAERQGPDQQRIPRGLQVVGMSEHGVDRPAVEGAHSGEVDGHRLPPAAAG